MTRRVKELPVSKHTERARQMLNAGAIEVRYGREYDSDTLRGLLAEVDRLRDGIAWLTESYHPPELVVAELRSLLDGEADG